MPKMSTAMVSVQEIHTIAVPICCLLVAGGCIEINHPCLVILAMGFIRSATIVDTPRLDLAKDMFTFAEFIHSSLRLVLTNPTIWQFMSLYFTVFSTTFVHCFSFT